MKGKPKEIEFKQKDLELGERKISKMNFSYIITLPKKFVKNTTNGQIITVVNLTMLSDGSLKITPTRVKNEPNEFSVM